MKKPGESRAFVRLEIRPAIGSCEYESEEKTSQSIVATESQRAEVPSEPGRV